MTTQRVSKSLARGLRVLSALKGHSLSGLSNSELAKATGESAPTINRIMNTLIAEGFATQLDSGRFALSVRVLQIARAHSHELDRVRRQADELDQRVQAGARN